MQNDTDDAVKNKILEEFLRVADTDVSNTAKSVRHYVNEAESLRRELQNSKRSGRLCRKQAVWIGVERYIHFFSNMIRAFNGVLGRVNKT
jgi:hypothetical protein